MKIGIHHIFAGYAKYILAIILMISIPFPAHANQMTLALSVQSSRLFLITIGMGSVCTSFAYDVNGNRTSQAVATVGTAPAKWGTGTFGCFVWGQ